MVQVNIRAAVGTWSASRVKNLQDDVISIQGLLKNAANKSGNTDYDPGTIDGKIHRTSSRSATILAIKAFQSTERQMGNPDGIVDVGQGTLAALNEFSFGGDPTAPVVSRKVGSPSIKVDRFREDSLSIIGKLSVNNHFVCYTLEEAWRDNRRNVSCAPEGTYPAYLRYTSLKSKREWCVELTNVPNRTAIQIHIGNTPSDTEGCVMVGTTNGSNFVGNSVAAYQKLQDAIFGPLGYTGYTRQQIRELAPEHGNVTVQFVDPFR